MELVGELVTGATSSGTQRAAALDHESIDDAVEDQPVIELSGGGLAGAWVKVLLGAIGEPDEIGHRLGGLVFEEIEGDVTVIGVQSRSGSHRAAFRGR